MARRDRNEPRSFWSGWAQQFAQPSQPRVHQLDLFELPVVDVPHGEIQYTGRMRWRCSKGHRHMSPEIAQRCEDGRRGST